MAYIDAVQTNRGPMLFYNLDQAVGPGAPNSRLDVLAVQYFLREIFKASPSHKPPGQLQVTGVADATTFQWILHFQQETKKGGRQIATDGRVDKALGLKGSISGLQYTILYMNLNLRKARPADYEKLAAASDCPPELVPHFTVQWLRSTE
ncbi:MAG: hypothetical protein AB7F89_03995 [Pirellulaceae bacterium]